MFCEELNEHHFEHNEFLQSLLRIGSYDKIQLLKWTIKNINKSLSLFFVHEIASKNCFLIEGHGCQWHRVFVAIHCYAEQQSLELFEWDIYYSDKPFEKMNERMEKRAEI